VQRLAPAVIVIFIATLAASCGSGSSTAQYRVVQTIPDAPANFDVALNGKNVFTNVSFGSAEPAVTGYSSASAGTDAIEAFETGTTTPVIDNTNLNLIAGTQSTVLLTGLYAAPSTVVLRDDNTTPISGHAELRIVDASPSAPASLDIYVVAPGVDITQRQPDFSALQFTQTSAYQDLTTFSSGYTQIMIIVTKSGDPTKTQLASQAYTPYEGQILTLVLVDVAGGGTLSFTPLELIDVDPLPPPTPQP